MRENTHTHTYKGKDETLWERPRGEIKSPVIQSQGCWVRNTLGNTSVVLSSHTIMGCLTELQAEKCVRRFYCVTVMWCSHTNLEPRTFKVQTRGHKASIPWTCFSVEWLSLPHSDTDTHMRVHTHAVSPLSHCLCLSPGRVSVCLCLSLSFPLCTILLPGSWGTTQE